jgi:hypothetical protein
MGVVQTTRLDRSVFEIDSLGSHSLNNRDSDRNYWRAKTPAERMEALELMRQIIYGYDPATTRLQRVLAITKLE